MDFRTEKQALKRVMHDFAESYKIHKENEMRKAQARLKPGEKLPAALDGGIFYDVEEKTAFAGEVLELVRKAREAVAAMRSKVNAEKAVAPSAEAAAVVSVMQNRGNVSKDELDAMIETYGSNYLFYNAMRDVADKNGYKHLYPESVLDDFTRDVDALEQTVNKTFTVHSAETGHASPAYAAFFEMSIDNALQEES